MLTTLEPISKRAPSFFGCQAAKLIGSLPDSRSTPIFVYASVLDEIIGFSHREVSRETGGFLLGGVFQDHGIYVEVQQFLPACGTDSKFSSLKFTHETWARLNQQITNEYPCQRVVGWHHTHPGFDVFLSQHDLFLHRNFFNQPWQIAMVVDPRQQEFGFFGWSGDEILNCGFVLVPGRPPQIAK